QLFGNNVEMPLDLFYLARSHAMTLPRDSDFWTIALFFRPDITKLDMTWPPARAAKIRTRHESGFGRDRHPHRGRGASGPLPGQRMRPARSTVAADRGARCAVGTLQGARHLSPDSGNLRHGGSRRPVSRSGQPRHDGRDRVEGAHARAHSLRSAEQPLPVR